MKTFVIVKRDDLSVLKCYDAEVKDDSSANRSYLEAEPICMHIEMTEDLDKDCLEAVLVAESGTPGEEDHVPEHYAVQEDAAKVAAKVQAGRDSKLAKMRADRAPKLDEADVMVNDLVCGDRDDTAAVQLYRNQLKSITDSYKDTDPMVGTDALDALEEDLSDLMWPSKP